MDFGFGDLLLLSAVFCVGVAFGALATWIGIAQKQLSIAPPLFGDFPLPPPPETTRPTNLDQLNAFEQAFSPADSPANLSASLLALSPLPIWVSNKNQQLIWANPAYQNLQPPMESLDHSADMPPPPSAFTKLPPHDDTPLRATLHEPHPNHPPQFEITRRSTQSQHFYYAQPLTLALKAEKSLASLMQTMTRTFALLPIGIAVFDSERKLATFNPAFAELTQLTPEYLVARPSLINLFDNLRAQSMIPEPRNYRSWRERLTSFEQQANDSMLSETWSLPGGHTWRVTGQPCSDGAIALLLEDLSLEISRARRYRDDLDLDQAVIDTLPEAVIAFSASGNLALANRAYIRLWGHDPTVRMDLTPDVRALTNYWRKRAPQDAHALWDRAENFLSALPPRQDWQASIELREHGPVTCRFHALSGGSSMVRFTLERQTLATLDAAHEPQASLPFELPPRPAPSLTPVLPLSTQGAQNSAIRSRFELAHRAAAPDCSHFTPKFTPTRRQAPLPPCEARGRG